jgi:murein L,D-transpeptidase YcbB/YkuD
VHQVVVSSIGADRARVHVGGATHEVTLASLAQSWNGDFQLLWKPSQPDAPDLALGARGEPVRILRQHLHQVSGLPPPDNAAEVYDEALQALVVQFQRRSGIAPDGIVGARTRALLDAAMSPASAPLLSAAVR